MAQKVEVVVTCDVHEGDSEAAETIEFAFNGQGYVIDLCAEHAEEVRVQFQDLISYARRAVGSRTRRRSAVSTTVGRTGPGSRGASDPERLRDIREWARSNGYPDLSSRGRIPRAVVEEYEAAH